ncbi:MAG: nitroreductase family protein [Thermotogaceae bacterium]|nr:nitroreductase family protein [Thermotogaceae bacterium]
MQFEEVLRKRRAIRRFKNEEIDNETLKKILKLAMFAPSSRGRRPVEFIVVRDKEKIRVLKEVRPDAFSWMDTTPIIIIVAVKDCGSWESDGAIAATYLWLSATNFGLGACWGHISTTYEDEVRKIFKVPENYRILCAIGMGYPDENVPPHSDDEFDPKKIHYESW